MPDRISYSPIDEPRLELLHLLCAVHHPGRVVPKTGVEQRNDRERQQRERGIQAKQDEEHRGQRQHRHEQGEQPAHHQVVHAVGVGFQAVDRIGRTRDDVVSKRQRLQMRQQPRAQCVDEPLPGVDLHLHVDHRERLRQDLQQQSPAHDQHEERRAAVAGQRDANAIEGTGQRPPLEDVVHDELQRPRRENAERDVRHGNRGEDRDAAAIRPQT